MPQVKLFLLKLKKAKRKAKVSLTFLQLILDHHEEGNTYHEEVEAETDFTEFPHGSSTHFSHHVLIRLLSADRWRIAEDDQAADEENQRHLKGHQRDQLNANLHSQTTVMISQTMRQQGCGYRCLKKTPERRNMQRKKNMPKPTCLKYSVFPTSNPKHSG